MPRPRLFFCLVLVLFAQSLHAFEITERAYGPTAAWGTPHVAFNGTNFLTLWKSGLGEIRGSLADSSGQVITAVSFLVLRDASLVDVKAAGADFLIAWSDLAGNAHLSLLDGNGRLLRHIGTPPHRFFLPVITVSSDRILILNATDVTFQFAGTIMTMDGAVVADGITITGTSPLIDAIGTPEGFTVAIASNHSVSIQDISNDGVIGPLRTVGAAVAPPGPNNYVAVSIASSGSAIFVAWLTHNEVVGNDTLAWTIVGSGTEHQLDKPVPVLLAMETFWTGTTFEVVASNAYNAATSLVVDVQPSGEQTRVPRTLPIDVRGIANAASVVFSAHQDATTAVTGSVVRVGQAIEQTSTTNISITARSQVDPVVVANVDGFSAAWFETTTDGVSTTAGRFTPSGASLDPSGIVLGSFQRYAFGSTPRAASSGLIDLIAWYDGENLVARRVDHTGAVLDADPIVIAPGAAPSAVAWNGERFFIIWVAEGGIASAFVDTAGAVTPVKYVTAASGAVYPTSISMAWDGSRFLIVWTALQQQQLICTCPLQIIGIRAIRVSADGTSLDAEPFVVTDAPQAALAHVASSGAESVVVVDDAYGPAYGTTAFFIDATHDAIEITRSVRVSDWIAPVLSAVTWDGSAYVIAHSYGAGLAWFWLSTPPAWIGTVRLSREGRLSTPLFRAARSAPPSIAADASGRVVTVVSEAVLEAGVSRVSAYFDDDMAALPRPPSAPVNVTPILENDGLTISWTPTSTDHEGFAIEVCATPTQCSISLGVPKDATNVHLAGYNAFDHVRVSAFNAGGTSSAPFIAPPAPPRRRAARH